MPFTDTNGAEEKEVMIAIREPLSPHPLGQEDPATQLPSSNREIDSTPT